MPSSWVSSKWGSKSLQTVCASLMVLKKIHLLKSYPGVLVGSTTINIQYIQGEDKNTACKHLEIQTGEKRKLRGTKNILPLCCKFHHNQVKLVKAFTLRMAFLFHTVDFWFQHHGIYQMETLILSLDREAMNCASIKNELSILTSIILPLY